MTVWDKRIAKAEKFMDPAWTHGRRVYERYQDKRDGTMGTTDLVKRANIFYANVNTLKESLFNSLPRADVYRLHKSDVADEASRVAAIIMQRGLDYELQCCDDFKGSVRAAILDRLVPGIGQVWVRFGMETDEQGAPLDGTEQIFLDRVYWEDFIYSPARSWSDVTWVGRKLQLTKAEIVERWGEDAMSQVQKDKGDKTGLTPSQINDDTYLIYEIWDKKKRQVSWVSKGAEEALEVKDDPYQLKDFFPCPPPLVANCTTTALLPVTDYHISQDQYNQLDVLYARISMIITAIKVAGLYDAESQAIGRLLEGQENKLIPVDNWAAMAERGGVKGMIDWYPIEQVVTVLQQLQQQYAAIKEVLQEVSGMSDITRGASNQYETAAAQKIKAGFASVRMNGYQRDVAEFVSSILNIMGEMVVQLYSDTKLQQIVGGLSPEDAQYVPQAIMILRNDLLASYKIQIQADSLVQADWALEKGQRMELLGFISQFTQSMGPMMSNPDVAPMMVGILKFALAGYRGGIEVEGLVDKALDSALQKQQEAQNNPQPPPPSPEQIKAQAEAQKMQAEMGMAREKAMLDAQLRQQETDSKLAVEQKQAEMDAEVQRQKMQFEAQLESQRMEAERQKQEMELLFQQRKYELQLEFERQKQGMALLSKQKEAEIKADAAEDAMEGGTDGSEMVED